MTELAPRCAVQLIMGERIVVVAWNTGSIDGADLVPVRAVRLPLHGLDLLTRYRRGDAVYSVSHLTSVGLPVSFTRGQDADLVVLRAEGSP